MRNELEMPSGYQWLIDRGLIGFEPFTQLQPWYCMPVEERFWANERWPKVSPNRLFVFARRQDNDSLACVSFGVNNVPIGVAIIQGWTPSGFDLVEEYSDFWLWMHQVIRDIEDWVNK